MIHALALAGCLSGPDEDDPGSACAKTIFYEDGDGDGFGDPQLTIQSCSPPDGFVSLAGDCDDNAKKINPTGTEKLYDALDNDCDPSTPDDDIDGDGAPLARDCDDTDAEVADHLPEVCDYKDNDCDGLKDDADDPIYFTDDDRMWFDADADSYGDPNLMIEHCVTLAGYALNADDCDDTNPSLPMDWVLDADGDGYGAGASISFGCAPPDVDAVAGLGLQDCDDTDASISPDAFDPCADGLDANCDGADSWCHVPPYDEFRLERAEITIYGSVIGGTFGTSLAALGDVDFDGFDEFVIGASAEGLSVPTGRVQFVQGPQYGVWFADEISDVALALSAGDRLGTSVARAGDVYGDGRVFAIVGTPGRNQGQTDAGAAFLLSALSGEAALLGAVEFEGVGLDANFGTAVAGVGDVDGNGLDDVLVSAPGALGTKGVASLFLSPPSSASGDEGDLLVEGDDPLDRIGAAVAGVGDWDGDGLADLVVSSAAYQGAVGVFSGALRGQVSLTDATVLALGRTDSAAGTSVAAGYDADGDGYNDLLIGAPGDDSNGVDAGSTFLLQGGTELANVVLATDASAEWRGQAGDASGWSVAWIGDFDGDDLGDFAVGAPESNANGQDSGAAYLMTGFTSGVLNLADEARAMLVGDVESGMAGSTVAGIGDLDHDGLDDLAVAATRNNTMLDDGGAVSILFGVE